MWNHSNSLIYAKFLEWNSAVSRNKKSKDSSYAYMYLIVNPIQTQYEDQTVDLAFLLCKSGIKKITHDIRCLMI